LDTIRTAAEPCRQSLGEISEKLPSGSLSEFYLLITWEADMTDNPQNRESQDRDRINISEKWELDYWSNKFGVRSEEMKATVKAVGPMAEGVRKKLEK
jgi:hypothetical protein